MQRADRHQVRLRPIDLDALVPADHRARIVWAWVEAQDLSAFRADIRAVEGHPGRPPIDPAILLALWLYATVDGVGSARALDRLCDEHDAYRWIAGGVPVNHHTLADFRVAHGPRLDALLTTSVAALMSEGLVSLERTAQDGMRVRASAGARSYRDRDALDRALATARERVTALRAELEADPGGTSRRLAARRERAARERIEGIERALARLPLIEARRRDPHYRGRRDAPAEASTTDAEVDFMAFADGGRRPGWNAQLVSDAQGGCIVHADVVAVTDQTQLGPGVDGVVRRYGRAPREHLADGGHRHLATIDRLALAGTTVYMPVQRPRRGVTRDPHLPMPGDTPAVAAWRVRMGTPAAKAVYRLRAHAAEWVNASLRNRGLTAVRVRTGPRVRAAVLLQVLAHNLLRADALRRARAEAAVA
jgi:transposase